MREIEVKWGKRGGGDVCWKMGPYQSGFGFRRGFTVGEEGIPRRWKWVDECIFRIAVQDVYSVNELWLGGFARGLIEAWYACVRYVELERIVGLYRDSAETV